MDTASYVTHVCHGKCFFEMKQAKTQAGDVQLQCVECMDSCRKEIPPEHQLFTHVTSGSRNRECITCNNFNVSHHAKLSLSMSQSDHKIQHIRETILDICNYRRAAMGENFRECRFEIAKPFLAKAGIKIKKELEEGLENFEWATWRV